MRIRTIAPAAVIAILAWSCEIDIGPQTSIWLHPIEAQANPCVTPEGYMIFCCPKPCPVIDPAKLGFETKQLETEISKLKSMVQQYQQWMQTLEGIGPQIAGLASKFLNAGSIKGLAQIPNVSLPSLMQGANLSSITSLKNSLSSLFSAGAASTANTAARQQLMQDSAVLAAAAGMNGRSVHADILTDASKMVESVKTANNTREDLAARNAITLALLQSLQTTNTLGSILGQLQGVSSLFQSGSSGGSSGSSGAAGVTITYAQPPLEQPTAISQSYQQVADAVTAIDLAIDLHNALVASNEMQASLTSPSLGVDFQQIQQVYQNALQSLTSSLAPFYADPAAAANAMLSSAADSVSAPWPEINARVQQEAAAAHNAATIAAQSPTTYGAYQCVDSDALNCQAQIYQAVSKNLFQLLDANNQVKWYAPLNEENINAQQTLQNETQTLSATYKVDFTNPSAVQDAISAAIQNAQAKIQAAQTDPAITAVSLGQITSVQQAITSLTADQGNNYYIPYDASTGVAPNSSAAPSPP